MATIEYQTDTYGNNQDIRWLAVSTNDYGRPWKRNNYAGKTYQVLGNFGSGATVVLQGSNVWDPVLTTDDDWQTLTDTTETAISHTSKDGGQILQNYRWIRPKVTGGTSPAIDIYISAAKAV